MKKVALEEALNFLREPLRKSGFEPVPMGTEEKVSAVIITGRDENMMNMQETQSSVPVIDARGLNEEEIVQELNNKLA